MLSIKDNQRAKIFKIEDKGSYALVTLSTSRKDKRDDQYKYTNWSFVRFVGKAYEKISNIQEGDKIVLKGAGLSKEEYKDSNGNRAWPKQPQFIVFNFEIYDPDDNNASGGLDTPPEVEEDSDDNELPF